MLWLVLLFQKPLLVYNIYRCVENNHEIVQACGGVCGGGVVGVGSASCGLGGPEDAPTNERYKS